MSEPLPIPDRPTLPTIDESQLQCLNQEPYEDLAVRDQLLQEHIKRLEAILRTTHKTNARSEQQ